MRVRTTTPRIGTRAPNLHTISRIFSPLPANQSRTVFVAIADNPRRSRSPASRSGGAPRGRKRYPDADCLQSPRRQRQQQRLHAARLKVQPAAPGNTGVAGRADERRVPASWSPGLPKRPARKRKGSARTGAICWRSLGWLRRPGADGASAPLAHDSQRWRQHGPARCRHARKISSSGGCRLHGRRLRRVVQRGLPSAPLAVPLLMVTDSPAATIGSRRAQGSHADRRPRRLARRPAARGRDVGLPTSPGSTTRAGRRRGRRRR